MNDSYITFSALIPLHRLSFLIYEVAVRLWWDPEVLGAHHCHQTSGLGAGLQRSLVVVWIWVRYGLCFPSPTSLRAPCLGQGVCSRSARSVRLGWRNWRAEQSGALWEIGLLWAVPTKEWPENGGVRDWTEPARPTGTEEKGVWEGVPELKKTPTICTLLTDGETKAQKHYTEQRFKPRPPWPPNYTLGPSLGML